MAKVVFLQNMWYPYLSVMYISALLKKHNHQCDLFIDDAHKNVIKEIAETNPDIIAFSTLTGNHQWVVDMASKLKKVTKALIFAGGAHPTFFPEMIEEKPIDIICIGEGEFPTLDLANAAENKKPITKIENLWIKEGNVIYKNPVRNLIQNLDEFPFPDRNLYFKYEHFRYLEDVDFITGRGCPYHCSFCSNHQLMEIYKGKGKYVRKRSTEGIIQEIKEAKKLFKKITFVHFQDDLMAISKSWLLNFLKIYSQEISLPFLCSIRADLVEEEIVKALKEHGCFYTCFGLESGNEELRNRLLNKNIANEQITRAANILNKYKLKFVTTDILGLPGETLEQAFETINMNIEIKASGTRPSVLQPYPGTEIYNYALRNGFINTTDLNNIAPSYFNTTVLKQKNIKELSNLHKLFSLAVKHPRLHFLIKWLIKLPPNPIFNLIFIYHFAEFQKETYNQSWLKIAKVGFKNLKMFKGKS